jgi:hypothetical protein
MCLKKQNCGEKPCLCKSYNYQLLVFTVKLSNMSLGEKRQSKTSIYLKIKRYANDMCGVNGEETHGRVVGCVVQH